MSTVAPSLPAAPPVRDVSLSPPWQKGLTLLIAALVLFWRKPDALLRPQLWAEDGTIFFLQQHLFGASAITMPYAGYLHLVPRLVACFAAHLVPTAWLPFAYNYTAFALTLGVAAGVFSPRLNLPFKPLLSLAVVCVPQPGNEVFLATVNLQWVLAVALITTLLKHPPAGDRKAVIRAALADSLTIILLGLTGPFLVFVAPLFLLRTLRDRGRYNIRLCALVFAVGAVQLPLFLGDALPTSNRLTGDNVAGLFAYKFATDLFLPRSLTLPLENWQIGAATTLAILFMARFGRIDRTTKQTIAALLGLSVLMFAATLWRFRDLPHTLFPLLNGSRYVYLPHVLIVWSLVLCLRPPGGRLNPVAAALLFLVLLQTALTNPSPPFADTRWAQYSRAIDRGEAVRVPLNPATWFVSVPARPTAPNR